MVSDSSKSLKNVAHVVRNILADGYAMIVHFFTQGVEVDALLLDHLTVLITEEHYRLFLLIP
jgi:hypothetical protein